MNFFKKLFTQRPLKANSTKDVYEKYNFKSTVKAEDLVAYNAQRFNGQVNPICSAPIKDMYFSRHGFVYVCCHNRSYPVGQYPHDSIKKIWTGEKSKKIRAALFKNNLSLGCQKCQVDMDNKAYPSVRANHFDLLPLNPNYPTMMEFELDTTCNLECAMCSGEFSTSIRKNREKLPPLKTFYDSNFVNELKEFIPHLKETRFSGGEPFLIKIYLEIWDKIVAQNSDCLISVQTNGTVLNTRIKEILNKGKFEIGVSLDSLDKNTFETIRQNANFEKVISNINFFSEYCSQKNTAFRLSMCVLRNNWHEMGKYVEFCNKHNAYTSFHKVINPEKEAIWCLSSKELNNIYNTLNNYDFGDTSSFNSIALQNIEHFQQYLKQIKTWAENQEKYEKEKGIFENISTAEMKSEFINDILREAENQNLSNEETTNIHDKVTLVFKNQSEDEQRNTILKLKKYNNKVILQSLTLKSIDELQKELSNLG
ncbi:MAG: radical SAM protein [Chitinophagales bacterium]|nr:radical SAM protein [Chitinophagales bacterium]